MKKFLFVIVSLTVSLALFSQNGQFEKPDYKKIKKEIKKRKSKFYYQKLMEKYLNSDTTMTLDEKRYLYYGYSFQTAYSPYGHSDYTDSLRAILQKENPSQGELNEIVRFSDSLLIENPFDLKAINLQLYSYKELGKNKEFEKKLNQMRIIVDALLSSGDGLKKETAFYVIYPSQEYDLLDILGFKFGGKQSLIEHYDYLTVENNSQEIKGLYFDVSPCLNSLNDMFK